MPNIREYQAPNLGLQPTETGIQAVAATARRVGAFFSEEAGATQVLAGATRQLAAETRRLGGETADLGAYQGHVTAQLGARFGSALQAAGTEAVNYVTHKEISQGGVEFAKAHSDLTDAWNNAVKTSDPNDQSISGKFREETLEPTLEKFRQAFNTEKGQAWAESHIQSLRNHFYQKTDADTATMAGQAVQANIQAQRQSWTNTAYKDPSSVPYLLEQARTSIAGTVDSSPALKGVTANKLRTDLTEQINGEIINAGAHGALLKSGDPEAVANSFKERWPQYVDAAQLDKAAKGVKNANRIDEERAERLAEKQAKQISTGRRDEYVQDIFSDTPTVTAKTVLGDERLLPQDREHLIGVLRRADRPEPLSRVSHETWMDLMGRMRATDDSRLTDDTPIWNAMKSGQLTRTDFNSLINEFKQARTPEGATLEKDRGQFTKTFSRLIDGAMNQAGIHSVLGTQRMYEFETDARREENVLRAKGLDPHLVYDPRSQYYFGKPENIAKYRVSFEESQRYESTLKAMDKAAADPRAMPEPGPSGPATPPQISSKSEYDKLEPGTDFFGANGKRYTKPKGK